MGKAKRLKPVKLAGKLLKIRKELNLSQGQMALEVGFEDSSFRNQISSFELGTREPPLPVLLKYARLAGISTDLLIDDESDLLF